MLFNSFSWKRHHATVSIVHSFTKNPQNLTREADIIITDVGVPNMIRGNWLKQGAVVIDAGTNAVKVITSCTFQVLETMTFFACVKVNGIAPILVIKLIGPLSMEYL